MDDNAARPRARLPVSPRQVVKTFKLDATEVAAFERLAESRGMDFSELVRHALYELIGEEPIG